MRSTILLILAVVGLHAATFRVCQSGCDATTIAAAHTSASCGDTIVVVVGGGSGANGDHIPASPLSIDKQCAAGNELTITTDQTSKLPLPGVAITPAYADGASRVVPRIASPVGGRIMLFATGTGHASGYKFVGLELFCTGNPVSATYAAPVRPCIGLVATGPQGGGPYDTAVNAVSDLPSNIIFDRVIVRQDPALNNDPHPVWFDVNGGSIINSWITVASDHQQDAQAVLMTSAQHVTLRNSYFSGVSEVLATGGATSPIHDFKDGGGQEGVTSTTGAISTDVVIEQNEVTHEPWQMNVNWSASSSVVKGQYVEGAAVVMPQVSDCKFQAMAGGATGTVEPTWSAHQSLGDTFVDGTVTWANVGACSGTKNLLESKASDGLIVRYNTFHDVYYAPQAPYGSQGSMFILSVRTAVSGGSGNWARIDNTVVENNVFRDSPFAFAVGQEDSFDPNSYPSLWPSVLGPYNITAATNDRLSVTTGRFGNCLISLTAGAGRTNQQIVDDVNASGCAGIRACLTAERFTIRASSDGSPTCDLATVGTLSLTDSIIAASTTRDASATLGITEGVTHYGCENPRTGAQYGCGELSNLTVRNNLLVGLNKDLAHTTDRLYAVSMGQSISGITVERNTFESDVISHGTGSYPNYYIVTFNSGSHTPLGVRIRNNMFGTRVGTPAFFSSNILNLYTNSGEALIYDFSAINWALCQDHLASRAAPPADVFCASTAGIYSNNLIPGATLHTSTTMDTMPSTGNTGYLHMPSSNFVDSWASVAFVDRTTFRASTYSTGSTVNKFLRGGHDGGAVGVDPANLPLINGLAVAASDRSAVMSFSVSAPIENYACVIRLSTDSSMLNSINPTGVVADVDPSIYTHPDSSDADWIPKTGTKRWFVLGHNAPLSPGTSYYYHLRCGGAMAAGSFTTSATQSGLSTLSFSRTPVASMGAVATCSVEYGTSYSRASDVIIGSSTDSAACATGTPHSVSVTSARGVPLYVRISYKDAGAGVLRAEPVDVFLP